jgi:LCP family protein required for cell wall assembly
VGAGVIVDNHRTKAKTVESSKESPKLINVDQEQISQQASHQQHRFNVLKTSLTTSAPSRPIAPRLFQGLLLATTATLSAIVGAGLMLMAPASLDGKASLPQGDQFMALFQNGLQYRLTRPVNILVLGIDRVLGSSDDSSEIFAGRSDTMLFIRLDPQQNSASILSIPRDTQVDIPGVGLSKINEANVVGGPALARDVVGKTLNQVPIDRYVRVSTSAFRELIDQLGGVEVFVPFPMSYVDNTQKLKIDLQQGWQTLDGDKAEQFARFRHDGYGDIGRVQRQQILIKALRKRLADPTVLPRLPGAMQVMQKYIDTNLNLEEMLALVQLGLKLDQKQVKMVMLPGHFGDPNQDTASYWLMNSNGRDRVLREYFHHTSPSTDSSTEAAIANTEPALKALNIAVQNATHQPGLGRQFVGYLESQGFEHINLIEDWPEPLNQTQIVVQQGDFTGANDLQKLLGLGDIDVTSTGDIESDLTIRVGLDWATRRASPQ